MGGYLSLKGAGVLVIGAGVLAAAAPAAAGRCGGTYPVDAPTTLAEVARQCNVRLSELREANPGVDPGDVRPGEHLAVPDETSSFASVSATHYAAESAAKAADRSDGDHPGGERADGAQRIRVRDHRTSSSAPIWLASDPVSGPGYSSTDRLSFQKLSARRIQIAGLPGGTTQFSVAQSRPTQLAACDAAKQNAPEADRKIMKAFPSPEGLYRNGNPDKRESAVLCTIAGIAISQPNGETPGIPLAHFGLARSGVPGYRVPDYTSIGFPAIRATPGGSTSFALTGEIVDIYRGCLLLQTPSGGLWRLSSGQQPAEDLLGRSVTVWGAPVVGGACGDGPSMAVSHTVYAEPWPVD